MTEKLLLPVLYFLSAFTVLLLLVQVRNFLAYSVGTRRLKEIYDFVKEANDKGEFQPEMWSLYNSLPSHEALVFDLRKWTYKQFFPEPLDELLRNLYANQGK